MKKILLSMFVIVCIFTCTACGKQEIVTKEPKISQMKAICELGVMDCYYHNVAKYFEEDASGILLWKKDKNFWIEYSGIVRIGVDASQIDMNIQDSEVTVTIPKAKVLSCIVDQESLTQDSFIVAKDSAKVEAEDEQRAFAEAEENMRKEAECDDALLSSAQQRVQDLLEDYIVNIGEAVGKEYTITWNILDDTSENTDEDTSEDTSEEMSEEVE